MFDSNCIPRRPGGRAAELTARFALWRPGALALALLVFGKSADAADWSCSFEADEGFISAQPAAGAIVNVQGGTAVVTTGTAAEGQQFIRFTPQLPDNTLVLTLGDEKPASRERLIRFAFRLTGDSEKPRLMLSCGQTVALRPVAGGVEVEIGDVGPQRFTIPSTVGAWLQVAIDQHLSDRTWDLSIGATVIARALPLQSSSAFPSHVLVFADGSLDLDAIHVTVTDGAGASAADAGSASSAENTAGGDGRSRSGSDLVARRNEAVTRSLGYAKAGNLDSVEDMITASSTEVRDTAEWHLDVATMLSTVTFSLHDDGRYTAAIALGRVVLEHLQQADQKFSGKTPKVIAAASAFMAARIYDDIMNDAEEAQRQYQRVMTIDARHGGAKEGLDAVARKLGKPAGQNSNPTHGK